VQRHLHPIRRTGCRFIQRVGEHLENQMRDAAIGVPANGVPNLGEVVGVDSDRPIVRAFH
jgi:hypothetical protein